MGRGGEMDTIKTIHTQCPFCRKRIKVIVEWQEESRTEVEFERVYETRWDCSIMPE